MLRKNCLEAILNPAPIEPKREILAPQVASPRPWSPESFSAREKTRSSSAESLMKGIADNLAINNQNVSDPEDNDNFSNPSIPPLSIRHLPIKREADHAEPSRQRHKHTFSAPDSDEAAEYKISRSGTPCQEEKPLSKCSSSTSLADDEDESVTLRWTSTTNAVTLSREYRATYSSPSLPDDDSSADEVVDSRNIITCQFGSCTAVINTLHSPLGYHLNDCHKPSAQDRNGNIACQWDSCGIHVKWRNLRRHIMESHLGSLSKECNGCGKMFSRSDALKRHQKHYCGGKKVPAQAGLGSEGVRLYPRPTFPNELLEPIPPTGRSVGRGRGRTPPRQRPYPNPSSTSDPYGHHDQRAFSGSQFPNTSSPPHRMISPQDHHQHNFHHHHHDNGRLQVLPSCSSPYERYPSATSDHPPRQTSRPAYDRYQSLSHHYPHPRPTLDAGRTSNSTDHEWQQSLEWDEGERRP